MYVRNSSATRMCTLVLGSEGSMLEFNVQSNAGTNSYNLQVLSRVSCLFDS